jgi:glycogen operon protein
MQDPVLAKVKLIAEPWDCGPGGYQVGRFPPGWGEWNDKDRDTVRDYWRGAATPAELAPRLCGSPETFNHRGRQPWASVNFITAHDGFTLHDLVTYNEKHNEANGEGNRDGNPNNHSWNHGVEGETGDPAINALRERQMKNMLATLLLSQGLPMILAGDEFGRTQKGNNNAYCQDNEISWVNWQHDERAQRLIGFTRRLLELRHRYPILRRVRWLSGAYDEELEVRDVTWLDATGEPLREEQWQEPWRRCFGMLLDGRARETGIRRRGEMATLLIVFNAWQDAVRFTLPPVVNGSGWTLRMDSSLPETPQEKRFEVGRAYEVTGRSMALFQLG